MAEDAKNIESSDSSIYELGFHMVPSVGEERLAEAVASLKGIIERGGGVFLMEEFPVIMPLAYTIRTVRAGKREKHNNAYFGWVKFELEARHLTRVKEDLDQDENLLRYLLIKTVKEDTRAPKRIFQKQQESAPIKSKTVPEKSAPVSEEELDRSIAELVVE